MGTLDVRAIVQKGGGPKRLHEKITRLAKLGKLRPDQMIAEKTIYSWFEGGIPERHWGSIMPLCKVTEGELHQANEALRKRVRPKKHPDNRAAA